MPVQGAVQDPFVGVARGRSAHNDDVERTIGPVVTPKAFSNQPLDAIPVDGPRGALTGDRKPHPS
jgi:hypothetical protein